MGSNTIGAVGVALPPPQALYPVTINNAPALSSTNAVSLPPGGNFLIPSGSWFVSTGLYSTIQCLDPVTNTWLPVPTGDQNGSNPSVQSDGTNFRINNPTGFPVAAMVNGSGSGFTSAPTVTLGGGSDSTWTAIVGGALSAININSAGSGANYAAPPIVNIASPPTPGVQATATAQISGGLITGFTIQNAGAGYTSPPAVTIIPQSSDLNATGTSKSITQAKATAVTSFNQQVTAVLLTNQGSITQTSVPALSFSGGGGSGAAATAIMALSITGVTVTTPGSGYTAPVGVMSFGGTVTSGANGIPNPRISNNVLDPRNVVFAASIGSGNGIAVNNTLITDGGLFQNTPSVVAIPGPAGVSPSALAVLAATVGGQTDTVFITPV